MNTTITLVRHGQTEWSKTGKHTGLTDVPLTGLGREQAEALGSMLEGAEYALVQTSPLRRAYDTMRLAGFTDQADTNPNLVEWDYGEYEGIATREVRESVPDWTIWTHPIEQGESVHEVGERADRVIEELLDVEGPVLVFAHGHYLRIFGARWIGLPAGAGQALSLSTATVSRLGWERETRVIESWNIECHLPSFDPLP